MTEQTRYVAEIGPYKDANNKTLYYIALYDEKGKWIGETDGWPTAKAAWGKLKPFRDIAKQATEEDPLVRNLTSYVPWWFNEENLIMQRTQTAQE